MIYGTVTNNDTTTRFVTGDTNLTSGIAGFAVTIDAYGNGHDTGFVPNTTFTVGKKYDLGKLWDKQCKQSLVLAYDL